MPTLIGNKFISRHSQGHDIGIRFMTISIVLILSTGLLAAILISSSSSSTYASTTTTNSSINKNEMSLPTQVRNFILNQIDKLLLGHSLVQYVQPLFTCGWLTILVSELILLSIATV